VSIDVGETVVIERPIDEVSAYVGDPSNAPEWCGHVATAAWETDPPMRLGSRIAFETRLLGRAHHDVHEVVELTPGEQIALRSGEGRFPTRTVATWRPVGWRVTHMTLRVHLEPTGPNRLLGPLVKRSVRNAMRDDLERLKHLLER
jgi:uncharacterized membrane protein